MTRGVLQRRWFARALGVLPPALGLLALALPLGGCGEGSSSTTNSAVPSSPAASIQAAASSVNAVASVAGVQISKSSYEHWLSIEQAAGAAANADHRALSFLITSQWVIGEAAGRKLAVSEAEVKQRFAQISKQSFPKAGALQKFLAKADETEADLLARVKVELLESRIAAQVTAHETGAQVRSVLASFQKAFQEHWRRYTTCKPGYVMEDCSEYNGKPENLTVPSRTTSSSAGRVSRPSGSASLSPAGVQVQPGFGGMTLTSPAFTANAGIPAQYTCDGADVSPPLQWHHVPAKAAALVLFVIGDST